MSRSSLQIFSIAERGDITLSMEDTGLFVLKEEIRKAIFLSKSSNLKPK